jgi:hypothetical protein
MDALEHFIRFGWRLGYDPNPDFSVGYYLARNADIREAGVNPFVHYAVSGRAEGRLGKPPGGFRAQALRELRTPEDKARSWRAGARPVAPGGGAARLAREAASKGSGARIVLGFSHDDYRVSTGGAQLCVALEAEAFAARGEVYLNLHPCAPSPYLAAAGEWPALSAVCDGETLGAFSAAEVLEAVASLAALGHGFVFVVHALHGHAPEFVARAHVTAGAPPAIFWLHDYFAACPSTTLMRNDIFFCGAPPALSQACAVCVHGAARAQHQARMRALFEAVPFTLAAPSDFALKSWGAAAAMPHRNSVVIPHCRFEPAAARPHRPQNDSMPARIAFAGHGGAMHKGWRVFEEAAIRHGGEKYEFIHFGEYDGGSPWFETRRVSVGADCPDRMTQALKEAAVDAVLAWSLWPETFSFVAHEAVASGAMLVAGAESGNIARLAAAHGGLIFANEDELFAAFRSGEIARAAAGRRGRIAGGRLVYGTMSAGLVAGGALAA